MMQRFLTCLALILSLNTHTLFAENQSTHPSALSGRFFNLSYIGNALSFTTTTPAWFYQFAGISSLTSGFGFLNCSQADNGFCLFSASDTLPGNLTLRGPALQPTFKLCLNGIGNTYSCESLNMAERFAYVANAAFGGTVSLCPINSTNGTFVNCVTLAAGILDTPKIIALNPTGTFLYATSRNNVAYLCPINTDGSLGSCSELNSYGTYDTPQGIALNNTGTLAYITNSFGVATPDGVSVCSINANGSFGSCNTTGNGFNQPIGIALNNIGTIAYVTNRGNNSVSFCLINTDGTFGTCRTTGNGFNQPTNISLNNAGTSAYVSNDLFVSLCPVNPDGSFGTCKTTGNGFNGPTGIALNNAGTFAYVANVLGNSVSLCTVNADGSLGNCNTTGNGFNTPVGIALF